MPKEYRIAAVDTRVCDERLKDRLLFLRGCLFDRIANLLEYHREVD
jgi:hypothetical protein